MKILLVLAGLTASAFAQSSNSTALTTIPSTTITSTGTLSISGISTASNGSLSLTATSAPITPSPSATPIVLDEYYLRAQTRNGAPHRFSGQYLAGWSLVANASADAVFVTNKKAAAKFYLNGTEIQVDFGTGRGWGMSVQTNGEQSRWYLVNIRYPVRNYIGSFFLNQTGLQWTPNETPPPHNGTAAALDAVFGGWMICNWWHDVPQLFWKLGLFNDTVAPPGCGDIYLVPEYKFK